MTELFSGLGRLGWLCSHELCPCARNFKQLLDALTWQCTLLQPLEGLCIVYCQSRRLGLWVIVANDFEEATIAGRTGIGSNDAVMRLLCFTYSGEAKLYGHGGQAIGNQAASPTPQPDRQGFLPWGHPSCRPCQPCPPCASSSFASRRIV